MIAHQDDAARQAAHDRLWSILLREPPADPLPVPDPDRDEQPDEDDGAEAPAA